MKSEIQVQGMSCTNCALGIKKSLEKDGFKEVEVDFANGTVFIDASNAELVEKAISKINKLGYNATLPYKEASIKARKIFTLQFKLIVAIIFTIPLLLSMFIPFNLLHNSYFQLALCLPVFIIGVMHFGRSAFFAVKSGVSNMDVLIILGSSASFIYSLYGTVNNLGHQYQFYETTASIITIILIGNFLEHKSVKKTTSAIDDLTKLQSNTAKLINSLGAGNNEVVIEVDVSKIIKGNILLVNSGDKIPVDAEIIWGSALIDESIITGESLPIQKNIHENVIGGSILLDGNIKIKATSVGKDTVLSQIIELVKKAQTEKPKLQNLADKISAVFVPAVVFISIITVLINYFFINIDFQEALLRGIAVLVISCPCALGLAIPTAVIVGVGTAASHGILVKGGNTLERVSKIKSVVFDKTGTLTTGKFKILNFETIDISEQDAKSVVLGIEKYSSHPIALSIVNELSSFSEWSFKSVKENKGIGMEAVDLNDNLFEINSLQTTKAIDNDKNHELYLYRNKLLVAKIGIADEVRSDAKDLINYLHERRFNTAILSGDKKIRCDNVGKLLNITDIYAEKSPDEKLKTLESISNKSYTAMVGDGINDAPALTMAQVGISLSNATQVAITSSDVVLINNKLGSIKNLMRIGSFSMRIIKQNLFWAFFYNILAIPIAASGFLNPMVAAFAMAFSDVIVIFNSLRIKLVFSRKS